MNDLKHCRNVICPSSPLVVADRRSQIFLSAAGVGWAMQLGLFGDVDSAKSGEKTDQKGKRRGNEIRVRIEANWKKRLAFAEAMKREAGVTAHTVWPIENGGLAYIGTGHIKSPEGRNIRQLYILAHECGHIFLHDKMPGYHLPSHIKELEAESYAHQAFRAHGMKVPAACTRFARWYVGSWIRKDRAAGIPIDPRAVDFVEGRRSPFEPLRMTPLEWQGPAAMRAMRWRRWRKSVGDMVAPTFREAAILFELSQFAFCFGYFVMMLAVAFGLLSVWLPGEPKGFDDAATLRMLPLYLTSGLVCICIRLSWYTLTRRQPGRGKSEARKWLEAPMESGWRERLSWWRRGVSPAPA
ncbi:MAG: hypothetical protein NW216_05065 [Hyphomicrobium sp.]|nr:hypothetical protein [Hyphomicrobium sp.]